MERRRGGGGERRLKTDAGVAQEPESLAEAQV